MKMDFTLIKKVEKDDACYKLLKTNFYRDYFVVISQNKHDFYCGSFKADRRRAEDLFDSIVDSSTEPYVLADILRDFEMQKV